MSLETVSTEMMSAEAVSSEAMSAETVRAGQAMTHVAHAVTQSARNVMAVAAKRRRVMQVPMGAVMTVAEVAAMEAVRAESSMGKVMVVHPGMAAVGSAESAVHVAKVGPANVMLPGWSPGAHCMMPAKVPARGVATARHMLRTMPRPVAMSPIVTSILLVIVTPGMMPMRRARMLAVVHVVTMSPMTVSARVL